eukprot:14267782-Ditylum_brightwellii.AAC.1
MDIADFLQLIPTENGAALFSPKKSVSGATEHYTPEGFTETFKNSEFGQYVHDYLAAPHLHAWNPSDGWTDLPPVIRRLSESSRLVFVRNHDVETNNAEEPLISSSQERALVPDDFKIQYCTK